MGYVFFRNSILVFDLYWIMRKKKSNMYIGYVFLRNSVLVFH